MPASKPTTNASPPWVIWISPPKKKSFLKRLDSLSITPVNSSCCSTSDSTTLLKFTGKLLLSIFSWVTALSSDFKVSRLFFKSSRKLNATPSSSKSLSFSDNSFKPFIPLINADKLASWLPSTKESILCCIALTSSKFSIEARPSKIESKLLSDSESSSLLLRLRRAFKASKSLPSSDISMSPLSTSWPNCPGSVPTDRILTGPLILSSSLSINPVALNTWLASIIILPPKVPRTALSPSLAKLPLLASI